MIKLERTAPHYGTRGGMFVRNFTDSDSIVRARAIPTACYCVKDATLIKIALMNTPQLSSRISADEGIQ